jgi:hypothetical protein
MRPLTLVFLIFGGMLSADTVTLRSGEAVQGTFLGGTARQIRVDVNGNIQTWDLGQVQSLVFSDAASAQTPAAPVTAYPASPAPVGITVPPDTQVTVRLIDSVDSQTARPGQTFRASIDEPIFVNGQSVIPRGADVLMKLVEEKQSGKIQGRTVLTLALDSIAVNGRRVPATSSDVKTESASRGARSAGVIGGGAGLGAIAGALGGGGKGAAIGATSGAAVGVGVEVLTKGQTVRIPSETRLIFQLRSPLQF